MKTNISIFIVFSALIFTHSSIGMILLEKKVKIRNSDFGMGKPYEEKKRKFKREFVEAVNDGNLLKVLHAKCKLAACYDKDDYQRAQVDNRRKILLNKAAAFSSVAAAATLAGFAVVKPRIWPILQSSITIASCAGAAYYANKVHKITPKNAFDPEKKWLDNELKLLKTAPVQAFFAQRETERNKELIQLLKEKQTTKHA
ncbi:MAG: hypothetical protein AB7F19_04025 [Candidatus Babeliales bacterium]